MANPVIGEVPLDIGGKRYRFVLGFYGLAALERRQKMPWPAVFQRAIDGSWGFDDILAIFSAGLMQHHEGFTEKQCAAMLDECGVEYLADKIVEGIRQVLPKDPPPGSANANPPMPSGGNGTASTVVG